MSLFLLTSILQKTNYRNHLTKARVMNADHLCQKANHTTCLCQVQVHTRISILYNTGIHFGTKRDICFQRQAHKIPKRDRFTSGRGLKNCCSAVYWEQKYFSNAIYPNTERVMRSSSVRYACSSRVLCTRGSGSV